MSSLAVASCCNHSLLTKSQIISRRSILPPAARRLPPSPCRWQHKQGRSALVKFVTLVFYGYMRCGLQLRARFADHAPPSQVIVHSCHNLVNADVLSLRSHVTSAPRLCCSCAHASAHPLAVTRILSFPLAPTTALRPAQWCAALHFAVRAFIVLVASHARPLRSTMI